MQNRSITLAHGNGGIESRELVEKLIYRYFQNDILVKSEDAAILETRGVAFTTDSFTVSPLFFSGGDIGKLSICGTCNDLAMMSTKPKYIAVSFMIEEGFEIAKFEQILQSMQRELKINGAKVVCGDTKVVPKGAVDKIFITTTGIGEPLIQDISASSITSGCAILLSRDIGAHGAAIFAAREGIGLSSELQSDCASLYPIVKELIDSGITPVAMRDATRGGVAAVLNEWANSSKVSIEVEEQAIKTSDEVNGICEMLGFEATALANEGTFVLALGSADAQKALKLLQTFNKNASIIAEVKQSSDHKVILKSEWGTKRFLEFPSGELLPRIC